MNTISKTHQNFSERLNNPRVLENPEEILGRNYKEVFNFWLILDDLSEEELKAVEERQCAFYYENRSEWDKAEYLAYEASKKVVGMNYAINAGNAVYTVTNSYAALWATTELIGMHLILEQNKPLTFFEMILEVL